MATKQSAPARKAAAKKGPRGPYCYALADQNGQVFYVGKGVRQRMFQHEKEARNGGIGAKCDRINAVLAAGHQIEYRILGEYDTHEEAYTAEREFIASFPGLTNIMAGGGAIPLPKERMRRRAKSMLARLMPYQEWRAALPERMAIALNAIAGSPQAFYDQLHKTLTDQVDDPSPNVFYAKADGSVACGWE